jgi:hypothetical protein
MYFSGVVDTYLMFSDAKKRSDFNVCPPQKIDYAYVAKAMRLYAATVLAQGGPAYPLPAEGHVIMAMEYMYPCKKPPNR